MSASLTWTAPASDLKKTADHPVCHMGIFMPKLLVLMKAHK